MKAIFDRFSSERHDAEMTPLAFYMAAVREKEREHVPLVGPSVDRRTFTYLAKVASNDNIKSLMCFCCGQIQPWTSSWKRMYEARTNQGSVSGNSIDMFTVSESLLRMASKNWSSFLQNFDVATYRQHYGAATDESHMPNEDNDSLRHLDIKLGDATHRITLICCPEDVTRDPHCNHDAKTLCKYCSIPLCHKCKLQICYYPYKGNIPMALANDNFWGYSNDIIWKYKVRWIEAAIASPCWTSLIVYYVEGDQGHLYTDEFGKQQFRSMIRGYPVSYHLPWEDILADLKKNCQDSDLTELPRPQECLKYMLRLHLRVANFDMKKMVRQVCRHIH